MLNLLCKPQEFSKCVRDALTRTPKPLSDEEMYKLSWEAATNRLLEAAAVDEKNVPMISRAVDSLLAGVHNIASSNEVRLVEKLGVVDEFQNLCQYY